MNAPVLAASAIQPRAYQLSALAYAREAFREYARDRAAADEKTRAEMALRLLLCLPTGGGKTVCAALFILGAVAKGKRVLFLAHRRELVTQAWAKLLEMGLGAESVGVIMGDGWITNPADGMLFDARRPNAPVQVASVQTLAKRALPPADVVFLDEAHHATAATNRKLIQHYAAQGAAIIGLTATPCRGDGRGLDDVFGRLHVIARPSELIAEGYLVAPEVYSVPPPDLSKVKSTGGDYDLDELGEAMDRAELVGKLVEHWQELANGRSTIVFATTVAHSQSIVGKFVAAGIKAEHLDGTTPTEERDAILGRLASGETQVVSNCQVLTEGFDCPRVKTVILARPTQSLGLFLQMAGRGLRPWNDVPALLLDHAGCARRHGLPQQDRVWTLEGRPKGSRRASSETDPSVKFCPQCSRTVLRGVLACPACGFEWDPAEIPAETDDKLVRITAAQADEAARMDLRRRIARAVYTLADVWIAAGWDAGEANTELNRGLARRFRGSRTKMSPEQLGRVLAYVESPAFATEFPAIERARPAPQPVVRLAPPPPLAELGIERQRPATVRVLPPAEEPEEVVSWAL